MVRRDGDSAWPRASARRWGWFTACEEGHQDLVVEDRRRQNKASARWARRYSSVRGPLPASDRMNRDRRGAIARRSIDVATTIAMFTQCDSDRDLTGGADQVLAILAANAPARPSGWARCIVPHLVLEAAEVDIGTVDLVRQRRSVPWDRRWDHPPMTHRVGMAMLAWLRTWAWALIAR
jgi:hypothetical protein